METRIIPDESLSNQIQVIYPDTERGSQQFRYKVYDIPAQTKFSFTMHWHPEYEIMLLLDGFLDFLVDGTLYHLRPNEALFVNSNCVHGHADFTAGYGHYLCFSFGEDFLFPDSGSYIYQRFFSPLHTGNYTFTKHITGSCAYEKEILSTLQHLAAYSHDIGSNALSIQICLLQIFNIMIREHAFDCVDHTLSKNALIKSALWYIKENYLSTLSVKEVAGFLNINVDYFCRLFKEHVGSAPKDYILALRIRHALHEMSRDSSRKLTDIAISSGFSEPNYFSRVFKNKMGITPSAYQKYLLTRPADESDLYSDISK